MKETHRVKLGKLMSYLLRHRPDKAGLALDESGLVLLEALVDAIHRQRGYDWVTAEDVWQVVATCDKGRFRLEGDRIGARYGHNRQVREVDPGEPVEPPEILYHGRCLVVPPSIDPFSPKNQEMDEATVHSILVHAGLASGPNGGPRYDRTLLSQHWTGLPEMAAAGSSGELTTDRQHHCSERRLVQCAG